MLRALLAPFVLFVATAALSGCGLFEFGTLEFLPSDGSTAVEPEGPQDLTTQRADGGTAPQDMNCTPTVIKAFATTDVYNKNAVCWQDGLNAKSYKQPMPFFCDIAFNPVLNLDNKNYVLEIDYEISGVTEPKLTRLLSLSPHVMNLDSDGVPYFDFMPNPRLGNHSAKIPFLSTSKQFNLVLSFQYNPSVTIGQNMNWNISRITLSTVCPKET